MISSINSNQVNNVAFFSESPPIMRPVRDEITECDVRDKLTKTTALINRSGTGTIISPRLVLTAGHLFLDRDGYINNGFETFASNPTDPRNANNLNVTKGLRGEGKSKLEIKEELSEKVRQDDKSKIDQITQQLAFTPTSEDYTQALNDQSNLYDDESSELENGNVELHFDYLDSLDDAKRVQGKLICAELSDLTDYALIELDEEIDDDRYELIDGITTEENETYVMVHHPDSSVQHVSYGHGYFHGTENFQFKLITQLDARQGSSGAGIFPFKLYKNRVRIIALHAEIVPTREAYSNALDISNNITEAHSLSNDEGGIPNLVSNTLISSFIERTLSEPKMTLLRYLINARVTLDGVEIPSDLLSNDHVQIIDTPADLPSVEQLEQQREEVRESFSENTQPLPMQEVVFSAGVDSETFQNFVASRDDAIPEFTEAQANQEHADSALNSWNTRL